MERTIPSGGSLPFGEGGITIVGVVENVKYTGIASPMDGVVYRPVRAKPVQALDDRRRERSGDPSRIANEIRQVVRSYDPGISIANVQPLTTWVSDSVAQPRFRALLMSSIAGIALDPGGDRPLRRDRLLDVAANLRDRPARRDRCAASGCDQDGAHRRRAPCRCRALSSASSASYWATRLLSAFLYGVTATDLPAFAGAAVALFVVALAGDVPACTKSLARRSDARR